MKQFILFTILLPVAFISHAQRCEVISMNHLGGNVSDNFVFPGAISFNDSSFYLTVQSNSSSGSIFTGCNSQPSGGGILMIYDKNYTSLVTNKCAPKGTEFMHYTFFTYPQNNGDTILMGTRETGSTGSDFAIERRNANGGVLWTKYYGGSGLESMNVAAETEDGGFIVATGSTSSDGDVGLHYGSAFDPDTWVFRLDNDGNMLWSKVLGGSGADLVRDVKLAVDGGCYLFGTTTSSDHDATGMKGGSDLHIIRLDSGGNKQWHRCLGGSGLDGGGYDPDIKAIADGNGGFYILNRTASLDGDVQYRLPDGADFWLLHIDSVANIIWERTFGGGSYQVPSSFCRATDGSFWMGGYSTHQDIPRGMTDVCYINTDGWVVHADSNGNFINQIVLGADQEERVELLHPLPDGTVLAGGRYRENSGLRSEGFPATSEGSFDIFIARLGPNTVSIAEQQKHLPQWELFPNPANDGLHIRTHDDKKYRLRCIDAGGKTIYRSRFRNEAYIPTAGWNNGIYQLEITDSDGRTGLKKAVITH
jgi:hypothetical protein